MRKVILGLGISLDQYIARKDGAVDWLSMDWDYDWMAFFNTIDTVLMGHKTLLKAFEMSADKKSNPYKGMATYVFSRKLTESPAEGVELVSGNLKGFIDRSEGKRRQRYMAFGRRRIWRKVFSMKIWLMRYISESHRSCSAKEFRFFPNLEREIQLRLISNKTYKHKKEDNGMVELFYEVKR